MSWHLVNVANLASSDELQRGAISVEQSGRHCRSTALVMPCSGDAAEATHWLVEMNAGERGIAGRGQVRRGGRRFARGGRLFAETCSRRGIDRFHLGPSTWQTRQP